MRNAIKHLFVYMQILYILYTIFSCSTFRCSYWGHLSKADWSAVNQSGKKRRNSLFNIERNRWRISYSSKTNPSFFDKYWITTNWHLPRWATNHYLRNIWRKLYLKFQAIYVETLVKIEIGLLYVYVISLDIQVMI